MSNQNLEWLATGQASSYPLSEFCDRISDTGESIPHDLVTDLHAAWPSEYGTHLFIAALTVRPTIVSIVLAVADEIDATTYTPILSFSGAAPARGVAQTLRPLVDGAGGFVTFGDTAEAWTGMFSTPRQALVLGRCGYPYLVDGVLTIGKQYRNTSLSGVVKLQAGNDISIVRETLTIDGNEVEAIVIGLQGGNPDRNVFEVYGPTCGARPESHTCGAPAVETINGVGPDCSGNIDIISEDGPQILLFADDSEAGGLALLDSIDLEQVCFAPEVDTLEGEVLCVFSSLAYPDFGSMSDFACDSLPFTETYVDGVADWTDVVSGGYEVQEISGVYRYAATNFTTKCIARVMHCEECHDVRVAIHGRIDTAGAADNFGILLNYKEQSGEVRYHVVQIDRTTQRIRFLRFDGDSLVVEHSAPLTSPVSLGKSYLLNVRVEGTYGTPLLTATVSSLSGELFAPTTATHTASLYGTADGQCGYFADRSKTAFYRFEIESV